MYTFSQYHKYHIRLVSSFYRMYSPLFSLLNEEFQLARRRAVPVFINIAAREASDSIYGLKIHIKARNIRKGNYVGTL